jgi:cellulose synthase operon protein C
MLMQTEAFLKAFDKSPYRPTISFRRAEALTTTEKFAEAEPLLKELVQSKDNAEIAGSRWFPRVWVLLAECQIRKKNYGEVEATVAAFKAWDPQSDKIHEAEEVLGRAYKNLAKFTESRAAFERSLADPASKGSETAAKSQLMIAETYFHQEDWKKAQEHYLKVYYNHKNYPEWQAPALFQAGMCDEKLGDLDQAAKTYAEVINKFRNSVFTEKAKERWAVLKNQPPKTSG